MPEIVDTPSSPEATVPSPQAEAAGAQLSADSVSPSATPPEAPAAEPAASDTSPPDASASDSCAEEAARAVRERLAAHGLELADEVQLAEVPGHVLAALLEAIPAPPPPPSEAERREQLVQRIANAHRLPRGMRDRLAGMVEQVRFSDSGAEEPALRVSDAVALLEESLPPQVLLGAEGLEGASHPRGDSFFTGDPHDLTDDQARQIAAAQLARTGFARKSA